MQETAASFSDRNPIRRVLPLVGNTPLLELEFELDGRGPRRIFAKLETLNFTGSIKDRMALHVLGLAYEQGRIEPGAEIIEATSGNTGISFAALGRALGHPVRIYIPAWMSEERLSILRGFGAEVVPVTHEQGGFLGSIRLAEERALQHAPSFLPRQFSNEANVEAHELGTGREILRQLVHIGLKPTAFVAGVGTGGTVMGVGRTLKRFDAAIRVHPLEPASSPVLTAKRKVGKHRIQGISDEFIPPIVHLEELDQIVAVDDGDAILMAQRLARELGLGVGISAGANVIGALRLAAELGPEAVVVTVLCDSNKKYLSTDLFREEPVRAGYVAPHAHPRRVRAL
ncbi:MAG: cysteine synthase family protein [Planctomycetes bacterium]|nr:cysteine synthase family protein [Planctomycetota bacterium]